MRPTAQKGLRVLYIVYWGTLEPLGQALVVPPVLRFAAEGVQVTLVTFEKPADLAERERLRECEDRFRAAGVSWIPLRYHRRPTLPATGWDVFQGAARSIIGALRHRPDLVHGRTYLGGVIGSLVSQALQRPFIFHNDGFWPDEQIDGGNWPAGSGKYRAAKRLEIALYRRADAVIALSEPARSLVTELQGVSRRTPTVVVPSCIDLSRFPKPTGQALRRSRMVYAGSLGGRYRTEELARFFMAARRELPTASLTIYSHSEAERIRTSLRAAGVPDSHWSVRYAPPTEIPAAIAAHDVGLFFLARGVSARVCSPTKIGEYWAAGLPVVTTPEVGDVDAIVRKERVGAIVEADTEQGRIGAVRELQQLLTDPDLSSRCRRAAERYYSLDRAVNTQLSLYQQLVAAPRRPAAVSETRIDG